MPLIAGQTDAYGAQALELQSFDVPTGVKSKEALVLNNAEVGVGALNAISITKDADLAKIRVLGSIMRSSSTIAIVSRKPLADLPAARIGYVEGTISEFYLIAQLRKAQQLDLYTQKKIELIALPPPGLAAAFANGDVDAVSAWEPFASQIEQSAIDAGQQVNVLRDPSLYNQQILILTSEAALTGNRTGVDKFVQALKGTSEYIGANRAEVAKSLEEYFGFPNNWLASGPIWPLVSFDFSADKAAIRTALIQDLELARLADVAEATEAGIDLALSAL